MDTSAGFLIKISLLQGQVNKAHKNFIKLLAKVADRTIIQEFKDHCDFLTERDDFNNQFNIILIFDIEIHYKYFNTHTLLDKCAYAQCWNEVKIDKKLAWQEQAATGSSGSNNKYQP